MQGIRSLWRAGQMLLHDPQPRFRSGADRDIRLPDQAPLLLFALGRTTGWIRTRWRNMRQVNSSAPVRVTQGRRRRVAPSDRRMRPVKGAYLRPQSFIDHAAVRIDLDRGGEDAWWCRRSPAATAPVSGAAPDRPIPVEAVR